MILKLKVNVPNTANCHEVLKLLNQAASARQGITLLTPREVAIDVDLIDVEQVPIHDGTKVVRHDN